MKNGFLEEVVLFCSLLKWAVLATLTGALIGVGVAFFLWAVQWATGLGATWPGRLLLLPFGGLATGIMVQKLAPEAGGHGTEAVIRAIHEHWGKVKAAVVPVKLLATVVTLGVWGSAGKEGPAAQIGSGIASLLADALRLTKADRRKLAVCGISAGFAGVFGLPIAGSIFGIEVLAVGGMFYEYLLPSFLAGVTAFEVIHRLGVVYDVYPLLQVPPVTEIILFKVAAVGIIIGLVSLLFIETMRVSSYWFQRISIPPVTRPVLGGFILALLGLLVSRQYLGLSLGLLHEALGGAEVPLLAWLWKILFVSVTLGSGFSGGVITPIFVIGATAGSILGSLFGLTAQAGAAMGMVAMVAGAANTPIAAAIMGIELFGPRFGIFAAAVSITSYLMVGYRSIYPSQILYAGKTASLQVETQVPVAEVHPKPAPAAISRIQFLARILHRI